MGNIFSSSDKGRKLNPFSLKMAEGAFVKKIGAPSGAISAALYFGTLPPVATLKALFKERLLSFDTYSSVCRNGRWVAPAGGVDVDKHLIQATVRSEAEMHAYCEAEMMKPLTNGTDAPLWECHLVTNTARGQRSMLFFRVEHALGLQDWSTRVPGPGAPAAAAPRAVPGAWARPTDPRYDECSGGSGGATRVLPLSPRSPPPAPQATGSLSTKCCRSWRRTRRARRCRPPRTRARRASRAASAA